MAWLIGVDVGGTFTDLYAVDPTTGRSAVHKVPSTPDDPSRAIVAGLEGLRDRKGVDIASMARFAHGTTVATNALIQRRGGRLALVTTKGFRDLLEIGRQVRPKIYDLQADYPPPLIPRERCFEAAERVGPKGDVITELAEAEVARVVSEVLDPVNGPIDGVAICLLFSFLNPEHEVRLAQALRAARPGLHLSVSSAVQPEFREYERMSTTVLNGFLQPQLTRYLDNLGRAVRTIAPVAAIGINQSSGGLMSVDRAAAMPIRTALSGPAAGVVGAVEVARRSGRPDIVTFDMGGTSTDVCLVRGGRAEKAVGREVAGFPVRLPAIDIHTVGAGGGSLAWFGPDGLLKVGPQSAGAVPGPACYARGGTEATVSDANVLLGRLPTQLVGGDMRLDVERACAAIAPIAQKLRVSLEEAALGIVRIVNANMVRAIRVVSVERGHDSRAFTLMPFGGAGGLHAADLAAALGMREILVPLAPGILCAEGLIVADLEESFVATCRTPLDGDLTAVAASLARLVEEARRWSDAEGIAPSARQMEVVLDLRYIGQNYELPVRVPGEDAGLPDIAVVRQLFLVAHEQSYGHHDPDAPVEVVNVRVTAIGRLPATAAAVARPTRGGARPRANRPAWFDARGPVEATVWSRDDLGPGAEIEGPAVIEQLDATTVLPPGARGLVDEHGSLLINLGAVSSDRKSP